MIDRIPSPPRRGATASFLALLALLATLPASPARAQTRPAAEAEAPGVATLTLEEAIEIALVNNYTVRSNRLDVRNADAQVREAWGQVLPQVNLSSSYTRNIKTANPFSGSEAGGFFQSFGYIDWLSYNEQARTDDDPSTEPISFGAFQDRRQEGLSEAGITAGGSDNPFGVANQFQNGISIEQTLFSGSAFAAIRGAQQLKDINQRAVDRQEQLLVDQVRRAYYQALLAESQADVTAESVGRTRRTVQEVSTQVAQGVTPKFQRLSAEVELANLETQLVQVRNQAAVAQDNLKMLLAIPVSQPIRLRGSLEAENRGAFQNIAVEDAFGLALERRPDLEQARLAIALREIDQRITRSQYFPTLSAFANLNYIGNVPDSRTNVLSDPNDPFSFSQTQSSFFSSSYWNPSVNVGLRLSWNLFNGFQTSARLQQRQVAISQARLNQEELLQSVRLEVERALRDLEAARLRIQSQDQNVQRAELNYEYAKARLQEGVASPLEEREASGQLDQSRLNYLQAVHDYLVARSAFATAVGLPPGLDGRGLQLTSN